MYVLCVTLLFVYLSHRIVDIVVRLLPVKWPTNASQNQRQFQIEPILTSRVERHNSLIICTSTIDAQNWHSIIFSLYCIERVVFWFDHIITRYTITEITIYDYLLIYFYFQFLRDRFVYGFANRFGSYESLCIFFVTSYWATHLPFFPVSH